MTSVRAMSFNIRYGRALDGRNRWGRRRRAVAEVIRSRDPDVVGLQEALAIQLDDMREDLPGYAALGLGREAARGGEHTAILVGRRAAVTQWGDQWLSESPEVPGSIGWDASMPRMCTWAILQIDGRPFVVVNTHLDHRGRASRTNGARLVAERARSPRVPAIVTGDLNCLETDEPFRVLAGSGLRDAVRDTDPAGTFHAYGTIDPPARIDYVLCDEGWTISGAEVVRDRPRGRWTSDHYPVLADLTMR